ncbi:hypothetical protein BST83_15940 [Polaribacter filamentus]|uniref:Uncharacterized protein n=1 Tax=Polaribacter filamentus TaxID=53483 RepID=A0A2S7L0K1_9FLAO|nr:hypothetical protein BST83_15940 [Polaribacter filamentus]
MIVYEAIRLCNYFFWIKTRISKALNCFHFSPYEFGLGLFGLLFFGLGSLIVVSIFLLYYNKIPKRNNSVSELTNPIYQKKDILLQLSSNDANL